MVQPNTIKGSHHPTLVVILISADAEWAVVKNHYSGAKIEGSPFGEWFQEPINLKAANNRIINPLEPTQLSVIFFQGGWGKIAAAASTQYVIDIWKPDLLLNFGTCGGFLEKVERFSIFLVEETIVYDIFEQMGDPVAHIAHYSTEIDLSWLKLNTPPPYPVRRSLLVSGDRDLVPGEIPELIQRYGASAGDWESGAIAYIARKNKQRLIILRGVTDLIGNNEGEAYQNSSLFIENTKIVMELLLNKFLNWVLGCYIESCNQP
jgi:adenosylhomocysteine nucleosidase